MFEGQTFTRTPKGDVALAEKGLRSFSHKMHLVLSLCDGTLEYTLLQSNLKRVDNLAEIVRHLIDNGYVEAEPSRRRRRGLFGNLARPAVEAPDTARAPSREPDRSPSAEFDALAIDDRDYPAAPTPPRGELSREYFKAIAAMSDALGDTFSDDVLQWSMDAEECDNPAAFKALVDAFEQIHADQVGRSRAAAFLKKLSINELTKEVA